MAKGLQLPAFYFHEFPWIQRWTTTLFGAKVLRVDIKLAEPKMLRVNVKSASNLPDVDKFSGKSDPYVVVGFQGKT